MTNETLTCEDLQRLAAQKIDDAEFLFRGNRYGSAYYLCGYAIELALKRRICLTLGWDEGYPNKKKKFENLTCFKTHDLALLLRLSGIKQRISEEHILAWSVVVDWEPEVRYSVQEMNEATASEMLNATKKLLGVL